MKVICTKICKTNIFMHEYISVGTVLEIENDLVVRTDPFGYIEIICEISSEFFKEHFNLVKGGKYVH